MHRPLKGLLAGQPEAIGRPRRLQQGGGWQEGRGGEGHVPGQPGCNAIMRGKEALSVHRSPI